MEDISSYDVVFDDFFSSTLAYTSQPYAEAVDILPSMTYTPYATSSKEPTIDIITLVQYKEDNLLSETRNDAEICDEYDDNSIMSPLISKEEMDVMDLSVESKY